MTVYKSSFFQIDKQNSMHHGYIRRLILAILMKNAKTNVEDAKPYNLRTYCGRESTSEGSCTVEICASEIVPNSMSFLNTWIFTMKNEVTHFENIKKTNEIAEVDLKIFASLAQSHFNAFKSTSLLAMKSIRDCLRIALKIEALL